MLYILCGLPFAGKSTLAGGLADAVGAELLSLDAIDNARGLGLDGHAIAPAEWAASYAEADRRIGQALSLGRSVVSDAAHLTRAERDHARTIAHGCGAATSVLYLPISLWDSNLAGGSKLPFVVVVRRRQAGCLAQ